MASRSPAVPRPGYVDAIFGGGTSRRRPHIHIFDAPRDATGLGLPIFDGRRRCDGAFPAGRTSMTTALSLPHIRVFDRLPAAADPLEPRPGPAAFPCLRRMRRLHIFDGGTLDATQWRLRPPAAADPIEPWARASACRVSVSSTDAAPSPLPIFDGGTLMRRDGAFPAARRCLRRHVDAMRRPPHEPQIRVDGASACHTVSSTSHLRLRRSLHGPAIASGTS
jgi:hypothetical protein